MKPYFILLLWLFSCGHSSAPVTPEPARLLTKAEMAKAMSELLVLEQQVSETQLQRPASLDTFYMHQHAVLGTLGIDSATYYQNFAYYSTRLNDMEEIVVMAADSLAAERDRQPPPSNP